jgi:threonine synthase
MSITYACISCGRELRADGALYRCPACGAVETGGGFPRGMLATIFAPREGLRPGLPVDPPSFLPIRILHPAVFPAGGTPLVEPRALRGRTGFPNLFFKNDTLNPSGSLKDRASLLVAEQALLLGEKRVVLASTGNAGASMAAAGAAYGLEVILFVPSAAPRAKLLQALMHGARVVPIKGAYDDAFKLSIEYTSKLGGINRNTGFNPFTIEGKKTVSLEIYNQLGCRPPEAVYVPTGDGVILAGVWKGFADLAKAGLAEKQPVLIAVQAEGSNAIARSWKEGRHVVLASSATIADSLSVACPANGEMALHCLRETRGRAVEVSDGEIRSAQAELGRESGIFVEPSSAAAWAGFLKDRKNLDPRARVVVLLTGTGFKDLGAAEKLVSVPEPTAPDLTAAVSLLERVYGIRTG